MPRSARCKRPGQPGSPATASRRTRRKAKAGSSALRRRDQLVALGRHAEVEEALLLHVAVAEGIAKRAVGIGDEGPPGGRAIGPGAVAAVRRRIAPGRLAPGLCLAMLDVRVDLLRRRRVGPHPLHRRAARGEKQKRQRTPFHALPFHGYWTASFVQMLTLGYRCDSILDKHPCPTMNLIDTPLALLHLNTTRPPPAAPRLTAH